MHAARKPRRRVLAIVVGVLFFVCLLEGGLRALGARLLLAQASQNRAAAAQEGATGVLCVGDSMTAGQYPRFLEAALEERLPGRDFRVFDAGRPSTNSWHVLRHIDDWVQRWEPRVVVAMIGYNDSGRVLPYRLATPERSLLPWEHLRVWKLARLVRARLSVAVPPPPDEIPPWRMTRDLYPRLASSLAERNIALVAMQYPSLPARSLEELLAALPGVRVLDNEALFAAEPDPWRDIYVDRFGGSFGHLSVRGNTLLAERVAEALADAPMLEDPP
jgi:lysophospholipase L1-like esterase